MTNNQLCRFFWVVGGLQLLLAHKLWFSRFIYSITFHAFNADDTWKEKNQQQLRCMRDDFQNRFV